MAILGRVVFTPPVCSLSAVYHRFVVAEVQENRLKRIYFISAGGKIAVRRGVPDFLFILMLLHMRVLLFSQYFFLDLNNI